MSNGSKNKNNIDLGIDLGFFSDKNKFKNNFEGEDGKNIEYVVYCRKSTDENSGKQVQSIPDQIKICMEFANKKELKVMKKPNFFPFETEFDLKKEDNEKDEYSKKIYQKYRNDFIIKEQRSSKTPGIRDKRRMLIDLVREGKVKGIISYLPDRLSRNMLESGELIDLLDKGMIDLKFTNFDFSNNASGKMMLGIHFSLSKEYSDNISENVKRGVESSLDRGHAQGNYKYGYFINDENRYEPHEKHFHLIKDMFFLKLHEGKSHKEVVDYLNENGFETTSGKKITKSKITNILTDSFYYGILRHSKDKRRGWDQRKLNKYYQPMITEKEHMILLNRRLGDKSSTSKKSIKEENYEIYPLENGVVKTADGYSMTPNLPNKKRFEKKLEKLQKDNPNLTIGDVIKPINIKFSSTNKNSKFYRLHITFDLIEKEIIKEFKKIKITESMYKDYVNECKNQLTTQKEYLKKERSKIQIQINKLVGERNNFISISLGKEKDELEKKVYEDRKSEYFLQIESLKKKLNGLDEKTKDILNDFDELTKTLKSLGDYYKKASYVRKKKISKILISNIIIKSQHKVEIYFNEGFDTLFVQNGGGYRTRTCDPLLVRQML